MTNFGITRSVMSTEYVVTSHIHIAEISSEVTAAFVPTNGALLRGLAKESR
jgi:hypothetical protein